MNFTFFILLLFGLQAVCLIASRRSMKALKTQNDYFLAGRGVRFFPLLMTFLATQLGGGLVLGSAEEAYRFGWWVLFYPLGVSLGLILLSLGIGHRLASFQISTVAQIFEVVYRSPWLKKVASLLSIATLFMILVAQVIGSQKFMLSLGLESSLWFIAFWAIVIAYTALGGLQAVVVTDIIQAAFFIAVFLFTFAYIAYYPPIALESLFETSSYSAGESFTFDTAKLYGWLLMPLLFMLIEQDMGQRCFAADNPSTVTKAAWWAAIGTFIMGCIPVFFGILAERIGIQIPPGASVLMATIIETTNPLITAMVGCAILAAIISTADSLINAIGSNLAQDFTIKGFSQENVRLPQIASGLISLAAIFCSFYFDNIVDLLVLSYELSVACLFVPIFAAMFKKQGHFPSAILAIAAGATGFILFKFMTPPIPKEVLSLICSLAGYFVGEIFCTFIAQSGIKQTEETLEQAT